mmetsp:Transcript_149455/g.278700  ORF Transcript_149455/g.278700 Transcript_149455/m.278700 type:complete len:289 (-) Transcript_149455:547-1413(-)
MSGGGPSIESSSKETVFRIRPRLLAGEVEDASLEDSPSSTISFPHVGVPGDVPGDASGLTRVRVSCLTNLFGAGTRVRVVMGDICDGASHDGASRFKPGTADLETISSMIVAFGKSSSSASSSSSSVTPTSRASALTCFILISMSSDRMFCQRSAFSASRRKSSSRGLLNMHRTKSSFEYVPTGNPLRSFSWSPGMMQCLSAQDRASQDLTTAVGGGLVWKPKDVTPSSATTLKDGAALSGDAPGDGSSSGATPSLGKQSLNSCRVMTFPGTKRLCCLTRETTVSTYL